MNITVDIKRSLICLVATVVAFVVLFGVLALLPTPYANGSVWPYANAVFIIPVATAIAGITFAILSLTKTREQWGLSLSLIVLTLVAVPALFFSGLVFLAFVLM